MTDRPSTGRGAMTPDALAMMDVIARSGRFAAAAVADTAQGLPGTGRALRWWLALSV